MIRSVIVLSCAIALMIAIWKSPGRNGQEQAEPNQRQSTIGAVVMPDENASPSQATNQRQPTANNNQQRRDDQSSGWVTAENLPEWLMLLLTAVGAVFAYWQLKQAESAVLLTQRADVLMDSITIAPQIHPLLAESHVLVKMKNFGPTRASRVTFPVFALSVDGVRYNANDLPTSNIPPGDEINPAINGIGRLIPATDLELINQGKKRMRFTAEYTYLDVFGVQHEGTAHAIYTPFARSGFRIEDGSQT